MVELQNFRIVLQRENNTFLAGETVAGQVVIDLNKTESIRALIIRFKGKGKSSLKAGRYNWEGNEDYLKQAFNLLQSDGNGNVDIPSGCHVYPFNFKLPENIPSSFENDHGHIRYSIKAIMGRPFKLDHETSLPFTVGALYDLAQDPNWTVPVSRELDKDLGCFPFCCENGSMDVNIRIPTSGYVAGEMIEAQIDVDNNSSSIDGTGIELCLKQVRIAQCHNLKRQQTKYTIVLQNLKIIISGVTDNESKIVGFTWKRKPFNKRDNVTVRLKVPDVPPSTFPHCKFFDVKYRLNVRVMNTGGCSIVEQSFPIVIGTRTVMTTQPLRNSCVIPSLSSVAPTASTETEDVRIPCLQSDLVRPIPVEGTISEILPPSYDDCIKKETKRRD